MNKAAQALGRLAKGKPKNYSAEEIARRSKILAAVNARKLNEETVQWPLDHPDQIRTPGTPKEHP